MLFRDDALHLNGHGPLAANDPEQAESHHHGFRADGQHPAFRHVPIVKQSDGRLGHLGRDGRTDTDALHPGHRVPLDAGRQGADHQYAGPARQLQADVRLWRQYLDHDAGPHVRLAREIRLRTGRHTDFSARPSGWRTCHTDFSASKAVGGPPTRIFRPPKRLADLPYGFFGLQSGWRTSHTDFSAPPAPFPFIRRRPTDSNPA